MTTSRQRRRHQAPPSYPLLTLCAGFTLVLACLTLGFILLEQALS